MSRIFVSTKLKRRKCSKSFSLINRSCHLSTCQENAYWNPNLDLKKPNETKIVWIKLLFSKIFDTFLNSWLASLILVGIRCKKFDILFFNGLLQDEFTKLKWQIQWNQSIINTAFYYLLHCCGCLFFSNKRFSMCKLPNHQLYKLFIAEQIFVIKINRKSLEKERNTFLNRVENSSLR